MRVARSLALLLAFAVVTAACSRDDDRDGSSRDGDRAGGPLDVASSESTAAPVDGGRLVVALDGEPDVLDPTRSALGGSAMTYALAVFDPLMALNADGDVVPYLAESLEHDDAYRTWTIRLPDSVRFHDGTPLDAAAVVATLDAHLASELSRPELRDVTSITAADDRTVVITTARPWVAFGAHLTGRLGMIVAPSMLEGDGIPVGTGPFTVTEWRPGDRMLLARNERYWRPGLPHLDELELRPGVDVDALARGEVDLVQTSDVDAISALRALDDIGIAETASGDTGEHRIVLNTAAHPFDERSCRRAVALAVDRDQLTAALGDDVLSAPSSGRDIDQARQNAAACVEALGTPSLSFVLRTGAGEREDRLGALLEDMWDDAGIDAEVDATDDAQRTLDALLGRFDAVVWHEDGVADPDQRFVRLDAAAVAPPGSLSPNLGRYADDELQDLLVDARGTPDPRARAELYVAAAAVVAADVPYLTLFTDRWAYGFAAGVGGVRLGLTLPDGGDAAARPGILSPVDLHRTRE